MRYEAFVSYSHRDKATARWLQNALERYRLPKTLRRAPGRAGARLRPVFRDDTELASSDDLTASILAAMEESAALIVVCSPRAAASRWTNEEIRAFRRLAPGRPILSLIIDGSPDPDAPDCAFPEALLRNEAGDPLPEPLAADLRPEADGKRGALLKLIAGLLGVGVDALRRRDQQRRLRVMGGVTAGALAVSVVTIVLAVLADRARDEAELRRDQAEGLIEFMLVELRGKLEPIGRLDVLDAVGDEAIGYFTALGELGTDGELLRRVQALRQIGEVRFAERDYDAARVAFTQSRDLALTLNQRDPADNERLFELSQAEFWVGYVDWQRGDLEGADRAFRLYDAHSRTLFERAPDNPDYKLEVTYAASNLASLARARGDADAALAYITEANRLNTELLEASPEDDWLRGELAQGLSWEGSIRADRGELAASEAAFRRALAGYERLHEGGEDKRQSEQLVHTLDLLSSALRRQGRLEEAEELAARCVSEAERLVAHDPLNGAWRRGLINGMLSMAELRLLAGQPGAARSWLERSAGPLEGAPEPSRFTGSQVTALLLRGRLALAERAPDRALALAREALTLARGEGDNTTLLQGGLPVAVLEGLRLEGDALQSLGDSEAAAAAWRQALEVLQQSGAGTPDARALRAGFHHRLDEESARDDLLATLEVMGYRDPRYLPTP